MILREWTKLENLPLSTRAANCLLNGDRPFKTVGEIWNKDDANLLRVPKLGQTTLDEIRKLMGYGPTALARGDDHATIHDDLQNAKRMLDTMSSRIDAMRDYIKALEDDLDAMSHKDDQP